jgi:O-antigen/teichoic acid export membrane protein
LGAVITIVLNLIFIPIYGYTASAWATLACYGSMVAISYWLGQKHYPVPYPLRKMVFYLILALGIYALSDFLALQDLLLKYGTHTILMLLFMGLVYVLEKPKKAIIS